ncbi:MAG: MarR family transcriptional regulator [Haloplasmataceae bacterium]|jgi:predicted Zn-ribbon and HTH transcriptional regulator|nr:MarR family transcriptional regulator [Haloplasmataceae bacterium]
MSNNELVLKVLTESQSPLKAAEIAEKAGLDKKDVDKAIKALKNEDKIQSPKMCFYSVK